jgi:sulfoxide reductase heme-binding subunit YedZ
VRTPDPADYAWWLASRASGLVALALITASVLLGLLMASKSLRRPMLNPILATMHEHLALAGLVAIAVHGITLLGDSWLHPGVSGISIPFVMEFKPVWTGLGIVSGYLAAILGLSFYFRRRIGAKRWRSMHRATILVYALAVAHTLGAGSDASEAWVRFPLLASAAAVFFLLVLRLLPARLDGERARWAPARPAQPSRNPMEVAS